MSISIIMPVYNAGHFLDSALSSILEQSFVDFELICIDDGSTDCSFMTISKFAEQDNRIKVISRKNKGLIYSLNQALSVARYDYIARMDADDICYKHRLETQYRFLENNPTISVVGCKYDLIDKAGRKIGQRSPPSNPFFLKNMLIFGSPLCHPSVMFNKKILGRELYYDDRFSACEDLELWFRLIKKGHILTNLSICLFKYRILESSISRTNFNKQLEKSAQLVSEFYPEVIDFDTAKRIYSKSLSLKDIVTVFNRMIERKQFYRGLFFFLYAFLKCRGV